MISLASAGLSCQTAFQLARFVGEQPFRLSFAQGPIDWLICPPDSLADWLDAGMPLFERGELDVRKGQVWWQRFDIYFWHGFYTRSIQTRWGPTQPRLDIKATFNHELSELAHQREKFARLDPLNTRFFVSNTQNNLESAVFTSGEEHRYRFSAATIQRLRDSLTRFYGGPIRLHCVTRSDRASASLLGKADTFVLDPDQSEWSGEESGWNALLKQCL